MAIQTTPHTESQQNADPAQSDLEPNQLRQDAGSGADAELYKNMDGAQTGGTRAFNANQGQGPKHNTEQFSAAQYGTGTRTPQSENQGITNHSASEESARQEKVVSQRPDALAGVDTEGNKV